MWLYGPSHTLSEKKSFVMTKTTTATEEFVLAKSGQYKQGLIKVSA